MWVVTCMAEITAVGVYVSYWLPEVPQWLPALLALIIMAIVNVISVRAFGEFEFWFALIKVVTILTMIIAGACDDTIWCRQSGGGNRHFQSLVPWWFLSLMVWKAWPWPALW
jgi:L-asparagine transporter-like permease